MADANAQDVGELFEVFDGLTAEYWDIILPHVAALHAYATHEVASVGVLLRDITTELFHTAMVPLLKE